MESRACPPADRPRGRDRVPQLQAHVAVQSVDPLRIHPPPFMKAICASVNFDLFMVLPRPTARIANAAKLEFSSKDRSNNREAGQSGSDGAGASNRTWGARSY